VISEKIFFGQKSQIPLYLQDHHSKHSHASATGALLLFQSMTVPTGSQALVIVVPTSLKSQERSPSGALMVYFLFLN
jgi:hypothetical protein